MRVYEYIFLNHLPQKEDGIILLREEHNNRRLINQYYITHAVCKPLLKNYKKYLSIEKDKQDFV